ncbi:DarT ssDNA thymidine ADP-ribosyltransferase family protein [Agromyces sp. MMS24-K17]|uniref:DarT ssDNA thymidine ADP-ribosyltransferase family protein n=1 Tax=Agromyces sp. MMS24-K17 TaxID=3372850 RepID=UPI003754F793
MADECIHGFDDGLCAICFPPPEPEPKAVPARVTASRAPRATVRPTAGAPASRGTRSLRSDAPPVDVRALRAYHVTHLDNLARILGTGGLVADVGEPGAAPVVDIAAPAVREYRRSTGLAGTDRPIAEYVPFFLSTDALLWDALRSGEPDPRLEPGDHRAAEFVLLVTTVGQAAGARAGQPGALVLADTDASLPGARIVAEPEQVERMLRILTRDDERSGLDSAELLVADGVPFERITLIGVSNDRVRDRVRQALAAVGAKTRVAVYPPWFQPAGGAGA